MTGIYDNPWAYELACGFRDVPAEVDALLGWLDAPPGSALELAAGPAEHARELARRGVRATALDLSPAMCAYAAERARLAGVALEVVEADMTAFRLGRRFDLIVTMLDSTAHLMTLDAFVAHLDRVAEHLAPGGRYIMEMSHPGDRLGSRPSVGTRWTVRRDGVRAEVEWGDLAQAMDPVTQIVDERVTIRVAREAGSGGGSEGDAELVELVELVEGVVPYRFWTATELAAAIRLSGALEPVAQYGDFADAGLSDPAAWRMITVLRAADPQG